MPKYAALITVTVDEFEAHNDDHADGIASFFARKILDAELSTNSDIKIHVDTFIKEED